MAKGQNAEGVAKNRQLALALTHLIEIVGEAASQVPREVQSQYPQIPWAKVVGTRNRLIHGYGFVDYKILWDTIVQDLPPLILELEQILPGK